MRNSSNNGRVLKLNSGIKKTIKRMRLIEGGDRTRSSELYWCSTSEIRSSNRSNRRSEAQTEDLNWSKLDLTEYLTEDLMGAPIENGIKGDYNNTVAPLTSIGSFDAPVLQVSTKRNLQNLRHYPTNFFIRQKIFEEDAKKFEKHAAIVNGVTHFNGHDEHG